MFKRTLFLFVLLNFGAWSVISQPLPMGFSEAEGRKQLDLEARYDALLDKENLDEWMEFMAARPHHVGSPYGKEVAEFMVEKFRSWGYDAQLATYEVLVPYPKVRTLEIVGENDYSAALMEREVEADPATAPSEEALPPYNCYSADGDVTAELVFVNYGLPSDYEALERLGIDVAGKIVIAKYGRSWRGIKPKVAAERGAIGCLIYSDPEEDGYYRGETYPEGPFKNETGVQRGSVLDMPLYPGDPLTPGIGATPDAERLDRAEAPTLLTIPVLPISYADALPLLEALQGPVAPDDFRGALPITYRVGPGPIRVHLALEFDWSLRTAYNVIARMEGVTWPDEWVIRGNHHDAWVHGASDPVSGMVAVMEEARAVAELAKNGNPPRRTIIYCGWDAEEPGLLGSTEWVEDHADELREHAVAYINTDGNGRGFLRAGGSHSLQAFFDQVSRSVTDPQTGLSVLDRRKAYQMVNGQNPPEQFQLSALGSGSDYTPFIQHLGIASLNLGFGGENSGGEYHTMYDTYTNYIRHKDPGFEYGKALAQVAGRSTLRLANAEVLPFTFTPLAETVTGYAESVMEETEKMRSQTARTNRLIEEGKYTAAADPTKRFVAPEKKEEVPFINFAPLQNAVHRLQETAKVLDASRAQMPNKTLFHSERLFTHEDGLPDRPWFKHHLYAPGFYTGYGVKTLPGVREAIESRDWPLAQQQIDRLAGLLESFCNTMNLDQ